MDIIEYNARLAALVEAAAVWRGTFIESDENGNREVAREFYAIQDAENAQARLLDAAEALADAANALAPRHARVSADLVGA